MKFVKGISLFFIYPVIVFGIGFFAGVQSVHFFYPGEQNSPVREENRMPETVQSDLEGDFMTVGKDDFQRVRTKEEDKSEIQEVVSSSETLCVDTEYVLEETDLLNGTVVETVWKLPDKYVGMNREQFLEAIELYEAFPPLSELERGFVNLEVLSFSRERVVVQMNYQYVRPSNSFYLAVRDNEVVVYLEDMETIYINTGISLEELPQSVQMQIMQMLWMENEEALYDFLETYSS